jgi:hypothetical protein
MYHVLYFSVIVHFTIRALFMCFICLLEQFKKISLHILKEIFVTETWFVSWK